MTDTFSNTASKPGFRLKLWRGERMCLIGMDVDSPADDFVGFAIEVQEPGATTFTPLNNRLAFSYTKPVDQAVTGGRWYSSLDAPFQKFRWIHFPDDPKGGTYTYRVTQMHMPPDNTLVPGLSLTSTIALDEVTYSEFLNLGFTRNFASSQAYADRYKNDPSFMPATADQSLKFKKVTTDVYKWLGFEAYELIFDLLNEVEADSTLSLDVFAYDLNEPDFVDKLAALKGRLRIIIDDSGSHAPPTSAESQAATLLATSAGVGNVKRMKFINLQHNKVLIVKSGGKPIKVLFGSCNFSFRGLYIQANNTLVVSANEVATLFEDVFDLAFQNAEKPGAQWFVNNAIATKWYPVTVPGKPPLTFCFSPHSNPALSLQPVADAIANAKSSVFFAIAFLYQTTTGPVRAAIDKLMQSTIFSYGISDKPGGLAVYKPDKSIGLVDFAYLKQNAPPPFDTEWSGGSGIHQHDKFVVTDFGLPTATVFTGSSNLAPSGEQGNGDNLVMIQDPRVATSYAIEALRVFDHLHFRVRMANAGTAAKPLQALTLQKPTAISGQPAWFAEYYKSGSQKEGDRKLFAS
jgi:hypothetical protein